MMEVVKAVLVVKIGVIAEIGVYTFGVPGGSCSNASWAEQWRRCGRAGFFGGTLSSCCWWCSRLCLFWNDFDRLSFRRTWLWR